MKSYRIPIALSILGVGSLALFQIIGSSVASDGTLKEPFFLIPLCLALIATSLGIALIGYIKNQSKK